MNSTTMSSAQELPEMITFKKDVAIKSSILI